eukprot:8627781-Prorocentrum_lima.AAC.1
MSFLPAPRAPRDLGRFDPRSALGCARVLRPASRVFSWSYRAHRRCRSLTRSRAGERRYPKGAPPPSPQ